MSVATLNLILPQSSVKVGASGFGAVLGCGIAPELKDALIVVKFLMVVVELKT